MKELESLLKKKVKSGLISKIVSAESGTERFAGEGKTTVIKHPVTNVVQSKGAGANKEMMRAEREDYEDDQYAQYLQEKALRKKRKEEEELESVR